MYAVGPHPRRTVHDQLWHLGQGKLDGAAAALPRISRMACIASNARRMLWQGQGWHVLRQRRVAGVQCDSVDSLHLYHSMHAVGLQYRRAFQVLHSVRTCGHDRGCTHSMVGGQADSEIDGMNVHPSALDGCLQLGATGAIAGATSGKGAQQTRVPAGVEAFVVHERSKTGSLRGLAQTNHASTKMSRSHHMLLSLEGSCVSMVYDLLTKAMPHSSSKASAVGEMVEGAMRQVMYSVRWHAALVASGEVPGAHAKSALALSPSNDLTSLATVMGVEIGRAHV